MGNRMCEAGNVCIGCVISDFQIFFLFLSASNQRSEVTGMVPLFSLFSFSFSLVQNMMRAVSNPVPSQSMPEIVIIPSCACAARDTVIVLSVC